jgi:hypothetical protein
MIRPGIVWIEKKASARYFTEIRQITRGANKGKFAVILPAQPSREVIVDQAAIRRLPKVEADKPVNMVAYAERLVMGPQDPGEVGGGYE